MSMLCPVLESDEFMFDAMISKGRVLLFYDQTCAVLRFINTSNTRENEAYILVKNLHNNGQLVEKPLIVHD
jgi:hypothetical protein